MKKFTTIGFSLTMLYVVAGLLFIAYALMAADALRVQYKIEDLQERVADIRDDSDELRLKLSEVSSLDYVLERSDTLSYTEISNVSYIEKSSESPLAAR